MTSFPNESTASPPSGGGGIWPEEMLEHLGACPVCGAEDRDVLLKDLHDDVFKCASGAWTLHRCKGCWNAYLDPRPDEKSIGKAYKSYYTHQYTEEREQFASLGIVRRIRRLAANGYTNQRYGTRMVPANKLLGLALWLVPFARLALDLQFRFLPAPSPGGKLLDVGCGNGAFLQYAASAGWEAYGADPDPVAVAKICDGGINARVGGIEVFADMLGAFDAVTFSHSIEHVHDPVRSLKAAMQMLRPNGVIYVDTPNIDSFGLREFGRHWRGLEVPRHLVIFSDRGLKELLIRQGWSGIRTIPRPKASIVMQKASNKLTRGGGSICD